MISKGLILGIGIIILGAILLINDKLIILINYFKMAKIPPAINPPITRMNHTFTRKIQNQCTCSKIYPYQMKYYSID